MEIKTTSSLRGNAKVNSLSIGDSGKGKTWFAGSIADYGKPFVIDAEKGLATVINKDFDLVEVNSFTEFGDACAWFLKNYEEKGYTHLVVDSITRLQQYLCRELAPDGKVTQPQWGEVLASLRKTVDWLTKGCPVPVHVNAMAMESRDDLTGMIKVYPNIQGSFRYDLSGYFDVVLYHDCQEKDGKQHYFVHTQGDTRIVAKNRFSETLPLQKYESNDYGIVNNIILKLKGEL